MRYAFWASAIRILLRNPPSAKCRCSRRSPAKHRPSGGPGQLLPGRRHAMLHDSDMSTVWVLVNVSKRSAAEFIWTTRLDITTDAIPIPFTPIPNVAASLINTRTLQARIVTTSWPEAEDNMYGHAGPCAPARSGNALIVPDAAVLRDTEISLCLRAKPGSNQFARRPVDGRRRAMPVTRKSPAASRRRERRLVTAVSSCSSRIHYSTKRAHIGAQR